MVRTSEYFFDQSLGVYDPGQIGAIVLGPAAFAISRSGAFEDSDPLGRKSGFANALRGFKLGEGVIDRFHLSAEEVILAHFTVVVAPQPSAIPENQWISQIRPSPHGTGNDAD